MCDIKTWNEGGTVHREKTRDCGIPSCPMSDANAR